MHPSKKQNLKNLREIEVENGIFGSQILELANFSTTDRSNETRKWEEEPILSLRFLENVFAMMLHHSLRRSEMYGTPSLVFREYVVGKGKPFESLASRGFWVFYFTCTCFFLLCPSSRHSDSCLTESHTLIHWEAGRSWFYSCRRFLGFD